MDLIDRYIYAVVRHLPVSRRNEIEKELRSLIADRLRDAAAKSAAGPAAGADSQATGAAPEDVHQAVPAAPDPAAVEAVLQKLGDPRRLADHYRGAARYIIGPLFYDLYWLVLRIVLIAVAFGITLAMGIEFALSPQGGLLPAVSGWLGALYQALLGGFAWVTLIFFINERYNEKARAGLGRQGEQWHPRQLQPVPARASQLKRADPILAIIFTLLIMIILNINPDVIGIYISDPGSTVAIPLFHPVTIRGYLPWINLVMGLTILVECIRLILGHWTVSLTFLYATGKVPPLVLWVWMLSDPALLNPDFLTAIRQVMGETALATHFETQVLKIMIIIAIAGFVIDLISLVVRAIRLTVQQRPAMLQ